MQLVYGHDAIMNVQIEANWNLIRNHKQTIIDKNNAWENKFCISLEYKIGNKILILEKSNKGKFDRDPYNQP